MDARGILIGAIAAATGATPGAVESEASRCALATRAWFFGHEGARPPHTPQGRDPSSTPAGPPYSHQRRPPREVRALMSRMADELASRRDEYYEGVRRDLDADPKEPWLLIYYDVMVEHYREVAAGRVPPWTGFEWMCDLAYPYVLLAYLSREADARTFSWAYSALVTSVEEFPLGPPADLTLARAIIEAVARFVDI
ncbi:hypothetical protein [Conexivisphaera calida]|uniref:Uncharacterized protein n=1 Tax=Conexivisphaera calida TaxID=1874277 RepID=A0A4P2VCT9_9ARCH|nr:hypothetical protein [Conexivisphaera calida]BBE42426.1 hypothetical protein NAS2_1037 [Conexivisphaera calida]